MPLGKVRTTSAGTSLNRTTALSPKLAAVLVASALLYAAGRALAPWAEARFGKDPGSFVVDEVVGYLITVAWVTPPSALTLGMGFVLFRLFDVLKPWPVRSLERLPGGDGIMLDDVAAGLMALAVMAILRHFVPGSEADIWSWNAGAASGS